MADDIHTFASIKSENCSPSGTPGANFSLGFFVLKVLLGPAAAVPNIAWSGSGSDDC